MKTESQDGTEMFARETWRGLEVGRAWTVAGGTMSVSEGLGLGAWDMVPWTGIPSQKHSGGEEQEVVGVPAACRGVGRNPVE